MSIYVHLKYKTKFTDKEILKKALKQANVSYREQKGELICSVSFYELHFKKNKDGEYEIKTKGYDDWKDDIIEFRKKITTHYNKLSQQELQKQVLENIKKQISLHKAMEIEQEQILEDKSVLLTIKV